MAGNFKPSDSILISTKKEAQYEALSDLHQEPFPSGGYWAGAFDGVGGSTGLYATIDLKIKFLTSVNIYGYCGYGYNTVLNIYDENKKILNDTYKNKNYNVNMKWDLMFKNVPAGIYILNSGLDLRNLNALISELFIEFSDSDSYFIYLESKYFSIADEYYDKLSKSYVNVPITSDLLDLFKSKGNKLPDYFKEKTIDGEIFKPSDKFNNYKLRKRKVII